MHATRALSSYDAILSQIDQALDAEADAAAQQGFLETLRARLSLEMEMIESRKQAEIEKPMSFREAAEQLGHPLAHVRAKAVERVGAMQAGDVIPVLDRIAFDDASLRVQLKALEALQKRQDGEGLEWVEHIAKTHIQEAMRTEAVRMLGRQGSVEMGPTLARIVFEDESPAVQREALDALRALPRNAGQVHLDRITEVHPEPWMRNEARRR